MKVYALLAKSGSPAEFSVRLLRANEDGRAEPSSGLQGCVWIAGARGTTVGMRLLGRLIANAIVGLVLLFVTNLFLSDDVPINALTLIICAIAGVAGWLVILILHLLGVAF